MSFLKVFLKSIGLAVITSPVLFAVGIAFELSHEQIQMLGLLSGIIIYGSYTAPQMDQVVREKAEALKKAREKNGSQKSDGN